MQTINKLLDTALKACNEPSDRQLAKHLDVSPSAISLWRKGKPIKDDHLMALIHLAQADPAIAVLVRTEGAESPEAKKAWSVVWDRLSPVTTVIGAMVLAIGMMPATSRAKPLDIQQLAQLDRAYSVYYVNVYDWSGAVTS
ncbi:DUF3693 domain-containing protein [Xanthomonas perforans]|uniref:DUF3693 domain-containing protein n=1 Tax=Xanthomonas perforans TaxID=442694 RepID=UPI00062D3AA5|nr:DUF3693 domain-containing protein [Xanthomonas perforans]KLC07946.1 hypothetical protein XP420_07735 [Xanthomonas perforans]KLC60431.1 hypothetical protein GEV872_14435 [Xanthomonas perforans]KLC71603.1 hypothetical protein GEV893_01195 [Xanthomonas perforans]KLC75557.1 hypothetical protein GEV904_12315 [Xanthomonas perforans]KLC77336.1 hypothetical protein GEV909_05855 [Xanthomonas perforans]